MITERLSSVTCYRESVHKLERNSLWNANTTATMAFSNFILLDNIHYNVACLASPRCVSFGLLHAETFPLLYKIPCCCPCSQQQQQHHHHHHWSNLWILFMTFSRRHFRDSLILRMSSPRVVLRGLRSAVHRLPVRISSNVIVPRETRGARLS